MQLFKILILAILINSCVSPFITEKESQTSIGLQPFENFDKTIIDSISNALKNIYNCKVIILESKKLPANAYVAIKTPRYRADSLLKYLKRIKPDSLDYILGLTNRDISTTKRDVNGYILQPTSKYLDWGVFGLGYMPGKSCVISTYRIQSKDYNKFINRLKKISVHEFGHNHGLNHCPSEKCVMKDAVETIKTVDFVYLGLCDKCKKEINITR